MFGNTVGLVNINLEKRKTSCRAVFVDLRHRFDKAVIGDRMLFGRYTADLTVTYGTDSKVTETVAFWVVP